MDRLHGFRTSFDRNEYVSKGYPQNGKFGPGRSIYTDDYYDDQELFFDNDDEKPRVWDLQEFHVQHPEGQTLIGDDIERVSHFGKGPKGYTRSDRLIHEDVCEALKRDASVDASEIDVTVDKGTVYLRGAVKDRPMKRAAESCVEDVAGVLDVLNELKVGGTDSHRASLSPSS